MLVFFATLILLATLLYLWKTRARLCKFCHPFYQSLWHFLPVQVFSGEMTPAHLAVVQHNAGAGASPSDGARQPRSHNRARQTRLLAPSWAGWAETHCYVHLAVVGPGC